MRMGCWAILGVAIGPVGGIRKLRRMTGTSVYLEIRSREKRRSGEWRTRDLLPFRSVIVFIIMKTNGKSLNDLLSERHPIDPHESSLPVPEKNDSVLAIGSEMKL